MTLWKGLFKRNIVLVIEAIAVTFLIVLAANVTQYLRMPSIISLTKTIISEMHRIGLRKLIIQIIGSYYVYIFVSSILLSIIAYCTFKAKYYQSTSHHHVHSFRNILGTIIIFFLLFYALSTHFTYNGRTQYAKLYDDFKNGRTGQQFKGYKQYYFLNHADETKKSLGRLKAKCNNSQEQALAQSLAGLVKRQDKSISTFRSYLANYNLIFKLVHIIYYSCAFIGFLLLSLCLLFYRCSLPQQGHAYGSIQQNEADEQKEQISVMNANKRSCFSVCIVFFILSILSICILATLVLSDFFLELKNGHPYDGNKQQTHLCSFHKLIGGFLINIDYQNQLQIINQYSQLKSLLSDLRQNQLVFEFGHLQGSLQIYMKACQWLQPYYQRNKQLQLLLCLLFYRHLYAFVYILWKFYCLIK